MRLCVQTVLVVAMLFGSKALSLPNPCLQLFNNGINMKRSWNAIRLAGTGPVFPGRPFGHWLIHACNRQQSSHAGSRLCFCAIVRQVERRPRLYLPLRIAFVKVALLLKCMLHVAVCQTGPGSSGGMTTVELFDALWACRGSFKGAMVVNGGATSLLYNPAMPALRRDLQYNHLVRPYS